MKSLYKDVQTILFHRKSTLEAREALKTRSPLSGEMFIPPAPDPFLTGSTEAGGFLINLFNVGRCVHHTSQGEAMNEAEGVTQFMDALF